MKKLALKYKLKQTNLGREAEERAINLKIGHTTLIIELIAMAQMTVCRYPIV